MLSLIDTELQPGAGMPEDIEYISCTSARSARLDEILNLVRRKKPAQRAAGHVDQLCSFGGRPRQISADSPRPRPAAGPLLVLRIDGSGDTSSCSSSSSSRGISSSSS